jgi:23S rRNA A1618 N6-methylase RlmF
MDEHAALKRIFSAAAIVRDKMRLFDLADATRKEAKEALEGAQVDLSNIIEEERTGQGQLTFTDAGGKATDGEHVANEARASAGSARPERAEGRMEGPPPAAKRPLDKVAARKARREKIEAEKKKAPSVADTVAAEEEGHADAEKKDAET